MIKNPYNTSDPEKLLKLKHQEADALRDVMRGLNGFNLKPKHILKITHNTLLAQLGVKKMKFIYRDGDQYIEGISRGWEELSKEGIGELPSEMEVIKVSPNHHPILFDLKVEYIIPFEYKNDIGAWFLVADFADSEIEKENDLIFIETLGNIVATALENHFLIGELLAQESIRRELEVAGQIQNQLLQYDFSEIVGAEISAVNVPHSQVGGDFFDVVTRVEKGFFVIIADVSGKGIGAALLMANLQAHLRALILSETRLESVIQKLHKSLMEITKGDRFVTLFMAHIRIADGEMDYVNAGHNPPILMQDGQVRELTKGTIPLGIITLPDDIQEGTVKIHKGDALFLYTDGLLEQMDENEEILGEEPILEAFKECVELSPEKVIEKMTILQKEHAKSTPPSDDITMMCVRFNQEKG